MDFRVYFTKDHIPEMIKYLEIISKEEGDESYMFCVTQDRYTEGVVYKIIIGSDSPQHTQFYISNVKTRTERPNVHNG